MQEIQSILTLTARAVFVDKVSDGGQDRVPYLEVQWPGHVPCPPLPGKCHLDIRDITILNDVIMYWDQTERTNI